MVINTYQYHSKDRPGRRYQPPRILGGFLLCALFCIQTSVYGEEKNLHPEETKIKRLEVFSGKKLKDEVKEEDLKQHDLIQAALEDRLEKPLNLEAISETPIKSDEGNLEQPQPGPTSPPERVSLMTLPRLNARALRSSILNTKPQTTMMAQALGWPVKPLTRPEPIENMIRWAPNELDSLTPPKKKTQINQVGILEHLGESGARLSVSPEYLTFFAQGGNNSKIQTIKIKNQGSGTLNFSSSETISWLSISTTSGSVSGSGETVLTVSINASGLTAASNPYSGEIVVSNDHDSDDREYIRIKLIVMNGEGLVTTYSYDANGNVSRRIDADGNVTEYEYDRTDRLSKILYPNGDTVVYEYDKNGNKTKVIDKTGITETIYDQFNRPFAVIFQELPTIVYHYDNAGNVKKIIYPDSREVNYDYDGDNRLTDVSYELDNTTYATIYAYNPNSGNLASKTLPNGVITTYQYDTANRLTDCINKKSTDELISSYQYTFDGNGNRKSVKETTLEGSGTTAYEYDELNRLTQTTYPDSTQVSYTYDAAGNRLTKTTNGDILNYQYDEDNRLVRAGNEIFLYDKRGNLTKRVTPEKTIGYTYDYENRLIKYEDGTKLVEYEYNGDGIRLSKTVDGTMTRFINDIRSPLTQVLMETTGNWYIKKRYVYGLDLISQEE